MHSPTVKVLLFPLPILIPATVALVSPIQLMEWKKRTRGGELEKRRGWKAKKELG
jgi:hypothetical protein